MKQPELGIKVAELRREKGLTQEALAEECQITPRTVQRIEAGEVEPRPYTLASLSEALDFELGRSELEKERLWLAGLHLSSVLCIVFIPLLIWSGLKTRSYQVDKHGRQVLNFQITMTLVLFAGAFCLAIGLLAGLILVNQEAVSVMLMSGFALAALLPLLLVGFFATFQGIANTLRVLNDQPTHYPLSIKFLK
jgi:uncharacterized Tic20 family protein/DNA-binding Xre family transcriptional regulator